MTTACRNSTISNTTTTTASCGSNKSSMVQVAPIRCFLNDIPNIIAQQEQQQRQYESRRFLHVSNEIESSLSSSLTCMTDYHTRKRRKVESRTPSPPSTLWLRLLGTVVNVSSIINTVNNNGNEILDVHPMTDENMDINPMTTTTEVQQRPHPHVYNHTMTLDDGTGTVIVIHVTLAMIQKIHIQSGMILDCIVRVERDSSSPQPQQQSSWNHPTISTNNNKNNHNNHNIRFIADQLVVQDSTKETLRWLELSYQASMKNRLALSTSSLTSNDYSNNDMKKDEDDNMRDDDDNNNNNNNNYSNNNNSTNISSPPLSLSPSASPKPMQYHTSQSSKWMGYPTRDLSSEDIYRIIASECEFVACCNHDHNKASHSSTVPASGSVGVSLQDLADCFDCSTSYVSTLVEELQNSCQIYQNENGLYTLL